MPILPEQTDIADGDKRLNLHRLAGRGPGGEPKGGGPAGEMVGIFLTVAAWRIPTILGSPTRLFWSQNARLLQHGILRPLSNGIRPKNGRKVLRSRSPANLDRSGRPNGRKTNGRKPNRRKGPPDGDPANAMDCSRGMRLLLRRLLLDELLNGLLSLNGLGAGAHPALLD